VLKFTRKFRCLNVKQQELCCAILKVAISSNLRSPQNGRWQDGDLSDNRVLLELRQLSTFIIAYVHTQFYSYNKKGENYWGDTGAGKDILQLVLINSGKVGESFELASCTFSHNKYGTLVAEATNFSVTD